MPWKETRPVEERFKFVMECQRNEMTMTALCRAFGISRQTGYKWLRRYLEDPVDPSSLQERPRRPMRSPQQVGSSVVEWVLWARKKRPHWGPRKLRVWLATEAPDVKLPAASTIGEILKRHGLVRRRRRRNRTPPYTQPFAQCTAPNQVWCVDFKGWFRTGDGVKCYPLTITDACSRFIIRCEGLLDPNGEESMEVFESAFAEYGLPEVIRSDNGPPFASTGAGGLTELSAWWIRLGIGHERIDPGKPQQNGRHERMHLTLKQETASPPQRDLRRQQRVFDRFRKLFNDARPHEALGMKTPANCYWPSARVLPARTPLLEPDFDVEQSLVDKQGKARWKRGFVYIGQALRHQLVDFRPVGDRTWQINFGPVVLGLFDERRWSHGLIRPKPRRRHRHARTATGTAPPFADGQLADELPTAKPPSPLSGRAELDVEKKQKPTQRVSAMSPV